MEVPQRPLLLGLRSLLVARRRSASVILRPGVQLGQSTVADRWTPGGYHGTSRGSIGSTTTARGSAKLFFPAGRIGGRYLGPSRPRSITGYFTFPLAPDGLRRHSRAQTQLRGHGAG